MLLKMQEIASRKHDAKMIPSSLSVVLGVDVGTSGVRSLASTSGGDVLAEAHAALSDLPAVGPAYDLDLRRCMGFDWCAPSGRAHRLDSAFAPGRCPGLD